MTTIDESATLARAGVYRRASRAAAASPFAPPVGLPLDPVHAPLAPPSVGSAAGGRLANPPAEPTPVAIHDDLSAAPFEASDERPVKPLVLVAAGVLIVALLAAAASLVLLSGDGETSLGAGADTTAATSAVSTTAPATTAAATSSATTASATVTSTATSAAPVTTATTPSTVETTAAPAPAPTSAPDPGPPPAVAPPASVPVTLPDGSFPPVLVVYNGASVLVDGAVPSQEAADTLETLALANATGPAVLTSRLTIDPAVPLNVGIRVIELESTRFPSGSAEIVGEHAAQFDRVADVMNALPHVTVLVIGHADQIGPEEENLLLSQERADAVFAYLVGKGIAAERLSARGVGETDLLAEDIGEDTLQLNRRTEFVFYGVLVPAA